MDFGKMTLEEMAEFEKSHSPAIGRKLATARCGARTRARTKLLVIARDPIASIKHVFRGLPWSAAHQLAGLLEVSITRLGELLQISPAAMKRRRISGFNSQESDRLLRFARIWNLACDAIGSTEGARTWLQRPQFGLNGVIPLDLARFEAGGRQVEQLLNRILHGVLV